VETLFITGAIFLGIGAAAGLAARAWRAAAGEPSTTSEPHWVLGRWLAPFAWWLLAAAAMCGLAALLGNL